MPTPQGAIPGSRVNPAPNVGNLWLNFDWRCLSGYALGEYSYESHQVLGIWDPETPETWDFCGFFRANHGFSECWLLTLYSSSITWTLLKCQKQKSKQKTLKTNAKKIDQSKTCVPISWSKANKSNSRCTVSCYLFLFLSCAGELRTMT